jgi:hypothetical protein
MFDPRGPEWATWYDRHCLVAPLDVRRALYVLLTSQLGRPYDTDWIYAWPLNRNWQDADAWVCSELIGWALQVEGVLTLPEKLRRITPAQLRQAIKASKAFQRM